MDLSKELTTAADQLEALITTHWDDLPARPGQELQLLADAMRIWAERSRRGPNLTPPDVIAPNPGAAPQTSHRLAHIERELAHLANQVATRRPDELAFELRAYAMQAGDASAAVTVLEERLRPPTRRELWHDTNVVPLLRAWRGPAAHTGGTAA